MWTALVLAGLTIVGTVCLIIVGSLLLGRSIINF